MTKNKFLNYILAAIICAVLTFSEAAPILASQADVAVSFDTEAETSAEDGADDASDSEADAASDAKGDSPFATTLYNYTAEMTWPAGPEIDAQGAYVINCNTGAVVYAKNKDQQFFPASITKILTALVVIENCDDLDEMVTFSHNAIYDLEDGGYSYIAEEGDQLSVRDCLYALMLQSSNECAYALAEHIGGTLEGFAVLMNERAQEAGANNSHFVTPHGLTNSEHVTTAHDMACIMRAAIANPTFLEIDSTVTYRTAPTTTNPEGFYCTMRHSMMRNTDYHDDRVIAGKTGYISAAKNTLVTYARDNGMDYIVVVLCVNGTEQACKDTRALLNYSFDNFTIQDVALGIDYESLEGQVAATIGDNEVASLTFDQSLKLLLPNDAAIPSMTYEYEAVSDISSYGEKYADAEALGILTTYIGGREAAKEMVKASFIHKSAVEEIIDDIVDTTDENGEKSYTKIIIFAAILLVLAIVVIICIVKIVKVIKGDSKASKSKENDSEYDKSEFGRSRKKR